MELVEGGYIKIKTQVPLQENSASNWLGFEDLQAETTCMGIDELIDTLNAAKAPLKDLPLLMGHYKNYKNQVYMDIIKDRLKRGA